MPHIEGGADPEEVFTDDLLAEDSDLGQAIAALTEAQAELGL